MIKYSTGTVFNVECDARVNTVNCLGVMGAGIALEYKLRYPEMFEEYKEKCLKKFIKLGKVDYWSTNQEIIVNFPTKYDFRYPSELKWIEYGLIDFLDTYKTLNINRVAFPKLGVGNGELDWIDVKRLMEMYLNDIELEVIICLDEDKKASGKELDMVTAFNKINLENTCKKINLTKKQIMKLNDSRPITRFRELLSVNSIGAKSYENLFRYFFNENHDDEYIEIEFDLS
ncbi:MAG: macro domain-containing protein [Erysipelotrichia bacterium]|jgi:O-acetyl-ADP-ribose deacetylase (regulator of RNase III)|nr:macro domain-containing protein [Erysipelotrichia bacterium]